MTEAEWRACGDPARMLDFLGGRATDRKLRLFAVACCRLLWDELQVDAAKTAIETNERFADGLASEQALSRARAAAHSAGWNARFLNVYEPLTPDGGVLSVRTVERPGVSEEYVKRLYFVAFMANVPSRLAADPMPMLRTDPVLSRSSPAVLRCVFGNPFDPAAADPSWLTSAVVALAHCIYQEKAFDRAPILADALQDAGCDNEEVLGHCRGAGPHARGCYVIDSLLGKL